MATDNLTGVLENLKNSASGEVITLNDVLRSFQRRGFGPIILAPALLVALPTGALPGVPALCGLFIAAMAGQLAFGLKHPWLPKRLRDFSIKRKTLERGIEKAQPYTKKIDRYIKPRWTFLINTVSKRIIAFICAIVALSMIPIGFIPFAVFPLAVTLALFGVGLSARDGLLIAVGLAILTISSMTLPRFIPEAQEIEIPYIDL